MIDVIAAKIAVDHCILLLSKKFIRWYYITGSCICQ